MAKATISNAQINASLEALKADIALAVESATTMRERVQHALVGCVSHWAITGSNKGLMDITNGFLNDLGQGVNLKAVKAWMEIHLCMIEAADGKSMVFKAIKATDLNTAKAAEEKWWSLKPQQVFSYDQTALILSLAKKDTKAQNELAANAEADVKIQDEVSIMIAALAAKVSEQLAA